MQAAYDIDRPNGMGRRQRGDPVLYVFRVYRKALTSLDSIENAAGILGTVRQKIRDVRNVIRNTVAPLMPSPADGLVLVKEYRMPLIVEAVIERPELRTTLTYTQGGFWIDTPFANAKGVTQWKITGRTHRTPAYVNGVAVDGDAALKEFKELIDDIFYPTEGHPADYELYWLNLNAPISAEDPFGEFEWRIWPGRSGVQSHQSADRPFTRFWNFEFAGLSSNRDLAKADDGFLKRLLGKGLLKTLLDKIGLGSALGIIDGVLGIVDEVHGLFTDIEGVVTAAMDYIRGVEMAIKYSFAKIRTLSNDVQRLISRLEEGWELARNLPDVFGDQLDLLRQSWPGLERHPNNALVAAEETRAIREFLLALLAQPESFAPPFSPADSLRSATVRVPGGTDIDRLAQLVNVDAELLIEANGLVFPFVDSREHPDRKVARIEAEIEHFQAIDADNAANGRPAQYEILLPTLQHELQAAIDDAEVNPAIEHVLYAGDEIRVPKLTSSQAPSIVGVQFGEVASMVGREARIATVTGQAVNEEDRLFGIDLYLTEDGDLEWEGDRKDFRLSRGLENIQLTLDRYVRLPLGALRFAPRVGNYTWEAHCRWAGPGQNRLLAYALWRTLMQDPRIKSVTRASTETYQGTARIVVDAELINDRQLTRAPVAAV